MILNLIFDLTLFITGVHIVDTKFGLHHYNDEDYKQIFYLENKSSISKNCTRHSEFEDIMKLHPNANEEFYQKALMCKYKNKARIVADYISGMTDRFAIREHKRLA